MSKQGKLNLSRKSIICWCVAFNVIIWIYFFVSFAMYSEPYSRHPGGLHFPVDPVTFWGYSIGLMSRVYQLSFVKVILVLEFPSALIVGLLNAMLFHPAVVRLHGLSAESFFLGIDLGGYEVVAVMVLSFVQWYWIGRALSWFVSSRGAQEHS